MSDAGRQRGGELVGWRRGWFPLTVGVWLHRRDPRVALDPQRGDAGERRNRILGARGLRCVLVVPVVTAEACSATTTVAIVHLAWRARRARHQPGVTRWPQIARTG